MRKKQIKNCGLLEQLDYSFNIGGEFPWLGFSYTWIYGKSKCTLFRDSKDWLLIFEVAVFNTGFGDFINIIYAFGNCIKKIGLQETIDLSVVEQIQVYGVRVPILDEDWNPPLDNVSVKIHNEKITYYPQKSDYEKLGINIEQKLSDDADFNNLIFACWFLFDTIEGEWFFKPEDLLLALNCSQKMELVCTLDEWEHTDVEGIKRPSDSFTFQSIDNFIKTGNMEFIRALNDRKSNTHWSERKSSLSNLLN